MNDKKVKIVIADDNKELCDILQTILKSEGYLTFAVHDGFSLMAFLKENQDVDVVILDLMMPEKNGISIFETIRSVSPASRIIIYTGYTNYKHSVFGRKADAFIDKAEGAEKLLETLKSFFD